MTTTRRRAPRAESIGQLLASIRADLGESCAVFGERLGVKRQNVHEIEQGKRSVSYTRAVEWAEALGYEPADFVRAVAQETIAAQGLPYQVRVSAA